MGGEKERSTAQRSGAARRLSTISGVGEIRADTLDDAVAVLNDVWPELLRHANVNWVDVGPKSVGAELTDSMAIRIFVERKMPIARMAPPEVLPEEIDGIVTDVVEAPLEEALRLSREAADELPESAALRMLRGRMLSEIGRSTEALEEFENALEIRPDDQEVLLGLAVALVETGQTDRADETLERVLEVNPDDARALTLRVSLLRQVGRLADAAQLAEEATDRLPREAMLWLARAQVGLATGELADARRSVDNAGEVGGDEAAIEKLRSELDRRTSDDHLPEDRDGSKSADRVFTIPDRPDAVDRLGRRPLAEALAKRLRYMRHDDPSSTFLLHIDGPWGSGKSSLMLYLAEDLGSDSLVVPFNAWREQRIGRPWWSLLVALRRAAFDEGGTKMRLRVFRNRIWALGLSYLVGILVAIALSLTVIAWLIWGEGANLEAAATVAVAGTAIVAFGSTILVLITNFSRRLLPGSMDRASTYVEYHEDPMQGVAEHFDDIIQLVERPVVFFVDDLDRCRADYVVELLENLQTLLMDRPRDASAGEPSRGQLKRRAWLPWKWRKSDEDDKSTENQRVPPPYFIVAADGRWIRTSYESAYEQFAGDVSYPGRPLGYLFLDKAFQVSTTLPTIDPQLRKKYLEYLLRVEGAADATKADKERQMRARADLEGSANDTEILERVASLGGDDYLYQFALRGEAAKMMADPTISAVREHELREFEDLLDPNPRAMKRFINAYGIERGLRTIEGRDPPLGHLARWTIVMMRWPDLAAVLREQPDIVERIGADPGADSGIRRSVVSLFQDVEVIKTVRGRQGDHGEPLDAEAIRLCAGLTTSHSTR